MNIGKSNENFKNRKLKYFNCNKYEHMVKKCQLKKKERETRKCFKCNNKGYIAKDCKGKQLIKNIKPKKNQTKKTTKKRDRVLEKILSRHSTRDFPYKFPE